MTRKLSSHRFAVLVLVLITVSAFVFPVSGQEQAAGKGAFLKPQVPTLVVSPVPGSPRASGRALLETLKSARLVQGTAKARGMKVRLEPGVYDLGRASLQMVTGVDIVGSGVDETEIVGFGQSSGDPDFSFAKGVVVGSAGGELQDLTVRCVNTPKRDACITMATGRGTPRLKNVRLLATSPEGAHWGLRNSQGTPRLEDVEIVVMNGMNNYGLVNVLHGARPDVRRTTITAVGSPGDNIGIFNEGGGLPARLEDVEITVMNGSRAVGMLTRLPGELAVTSAKRSGGPTLKMIGVEVAALDAFQSTGLLGGGFVLEMRQSRVLSDGAAIDLGPRCDVEVTSSELRSNGVFVHAYDVRITGTALLGDGRVLAYGDASCTGNHLEDGSTVDFCP